MIASQVEAGTPVISAMREAAYAPCSPAVLPFDRTIPPFVDCAEVTAAFAA